MDYLTGKQQWALPDLYWPTTDNGNTYISHEQSVSSIPRTR